MLLSGIQHVAFLTGDTQRLVDFYAEVFEATSATLQHQDGFRVTAIWIGDTAELNVFEIDGNTEHERQVPMFGRGRVDHLALQASSIDSFMEIRSRLAARDATDGFVTDFGPILSLFFVDPDGLEGEVVLWVSHDGEVLPPGTPAVGYDD